MPACEIPVMFAAVNNSNYLGDASHRREGKGDAGGLPFKGEAQVHAYVRWLRGGKYAD